MLAAALTLAAGAARARDVLVHGRHLFSLEVVEGRARVRVVDPRGVPAHLTDDEVLAFLTDDGDLYVVEVTPREDGTLPELSVAWLRQLGEHLGDPSFSTPLLGFASAGQALASEGELATGDLVVGKRDFDGNHLVAIVSRAELLSELECQRTLAAL